MEYGDVLTGRIVKYPTVRLFYCQEKEMERHVMQTQDVAKLLNVAETTVRQWTFERLLPAHRIGGKVFYNREEILALVGGSGKGVKDPVLDYLERLVDARRRELETTGENVSYAKQGEAV
jgi:hypothetical protein